MRQQLATSVLPLRVLGTVFFAVAPLILASPLDGRTDCSLGLLKHGHSGIYGAIRDNAGMRFDGCPGIFRGLSDSLARVGWPTLPRSEGWSWLHRRNLGDYRTYVASAPTGDYKTLLRQQYY